MARLLTREIPVVWVDEDDNVYRETVIALDYSDFPGYEEWETPYWHLLPKG